MQFVFVVAIAMLLGLILTRIVQMTSERFGVLAAPRADRWHKKPTSMLGGVAIYLSFMICYLGFAPRNHAILSILVAGSFLFVVGLIDDIYHIKPQTKLVAQLVSAAVVVNAGLRLRWTNNDALNSLITVLWLVGITNALNLLDNMDGLATGISAIACVFLTVSFLLSGQYSEACVTAILGGVTLSFLVLNFNPALIFMGDSGSLFIGFVLSASALLSDYGRATNLSSVLLTPVLIMMIPIFDTSVVMISRRLSGRPVSDGGCDHTSHRLVALGMSERRSVIMLYFFAGISGTLALLIRLLKPTDMMILMPSFALLVILLGFELGKVRVYREGLPVKPGYRLISVVADFSHKRRILEVLLDVVLVVLAYYGAYLVFSHGLPPSEQMADLVGALPLVMAAQMGCFWLGGIYKGEWRYARVDDLVLIGKSILFGVTASAALLMLTGKSSGMSPEVVVANMSLLMIFMTASRLSFRVLPNLILGRTSTVAQLEPSLGMGPGNGGNLMFQDIILRTAVGLGFVLILATFFSFSSLAAPQQENALVGARTAPPKGETVVGTVTGAGQISVNGYHAVTGATLLNNSSISTGSDGVATLTLASIGQVKLFPGSAINLAVKSNQVRVDLIRGSMIQSLSAGAHGELGLPQGRSGLSVERGQVELAAGGLILRQGQQGNSAGVTSALVSGNSLLAVTAVQTDRALPEVAARTRATLTGAAAQTPTRTLTALALESVKSAVTQVATRQTGSTTPDNALLLTAVQPGTPRRPPASPTRP
ncbi:MAG: hypothetical protein HY650_10600 [Acidobacteria bacterium]|nr:hypothetical protein [Acidobacteriota bacterium]